MEKKTEMVSLNDQLYNDFFVQELETRLETDPLMTGGLVDFLTLNGGTMQAAGCFCDPIFCSGGFYCGEKS